MKFRLNLTYREKLLDFSKQSIKIKYSHTDTTPCNFSILMFEVPNSQRLLGHGHLPTEYDIDMRRGRGGERGG